MPGKLIEWTGVAHNCFTHRPVPANILVAFGEDTVTYTIKRGPGETVTLTRDDPAVIDFISRMARAVVRSPQHGP